jgi:hypothetical protein
MSNERQHTYHRASQYASHAARALGGARHPEASYQAKTQVHGNSVFFPA